LDRGFPRDLGLDLGLDLERSLAALGLDFLFDLLMDRFDRLLFEGLL
jgi:hypothetical protein